MDTAQIRSLPDALERFNRKERNLLIRHVLGDINRPPSLGPEFCQAVSEKLNLHPPLSTEAWWATDFHISWLAGAVAIFLAAEEQPNLFNNLENSKSKLIEGNQEDIDLVIATEDHLILIEAKTYGAFEEEQLKSKLDRLNLLYEFSRPLAGKRGRGIHFRLLLTSAKEPEAPIVNVGWPPWACEGSVLPSKIPWIQLPLPARLEVTRCNDDGSECASGRFWCYRDSRTTAIRSVAQASGS